MGFSVTGSDPNSNKVTDYLKKLGIKIYHAHSADNITKNIDCIVATGAAKDNHIEIIAAKKLDIPVLHRADMLAEIMRDNYGIAISGAHGKSSTTGLITSIFNTNNDAKFAIGGSFGGIPTGAQHGSSKYMIIEADESDASFVKYCPQIVVVTNIEKEHMYSFRDEEHLKQSYLDFINTVPESSGKVILCLDDSGVQSILNKINKKLNIITYGTDQNADYRLLNYEQKVPGHPGQARSVQLTRHSREGGNLDPGSLLCKARDDGIIIKIQDKNKNIIKLEVAAQGAHNALNATAAVAVGLEENLSLEQIKTGLENYPGVGRRFEQHGDIRINNKKIKLLEDYGHHPREVKTIVDTVKEIWPKKRIVMAFQPHRYTRTRDCFDDFAKELSLADQIILLPVYAAGEDFIAGADSQALADKIAEFNKNIYLVDDNNFVYTAENLLEDNDILIIQGAGNIGNFVNNFK